MVSALIQSNTSTKSSGPGSMMQPVYFVLEKFPLESLLLSYYLLISQYTSANGI
jgi:hypothetical protein